MGYISEEKETRECFGILCKTSVDTSKEYVWAYTLEEAKESLANMGFEIVE